MRYPKPRAGGGVCGRARGRSGVKTGRTENIMRGRGIARVKLLGFQASDALDIRLVVLPAGHGIGAA
jgi:hypothetical protein